MEKPSTSGRAQVESVQIQKDTIAMAYYNTFEAWLRGRGFRAAGMSALIGRRSTLSAGQRSMRCAREGTVIRC
jgi:hypothetical protein